MKPSSIGSWLLAASGLCATVSPAQLVGSVRDAAGRSVPGAFVAVVPSEPGADEPTTRPLATARTAEDGTFRLPPVGEGSLRLSVTASGRGTTFLHAVPPSGGGPLSIRLDEARATLSGRLRWADGEGPATGQLRAHRISDDAGAVFYAEANGGGSFRLGLPRGTYLLLPVVEGAVPSPVEVDADRDRSLDVDLVRAGPAPESVVAWIRREARPLATLDPGASAEDQVLTASVLAGARIVGVGEPTHGSREPIRLWHRLFESLAREEGFTVLALEGSFRGGMLADGFVQGGAGGARDAVHALRAFESREILDLVEWLRRANESRGGRPPLHVAGVDVNPPAPAAREALDALARTDPVAAGALRRDLDAMTDDRTQFDLASLPAARQEALRRAALSLVRALEQEERASPGAEDWPLLAQYARNVAGSVEMQLAPDLRASVALRDRAMAENVAWLLERHGPESRILVAAHNRHIAVRDGMLGRFLRDRWGADYRAVGFVFDHGGFRAAEYAFGRGGPLREFEVGRSPEGSLAEAFSRAGAVDAILDLRRLPSEGPVRDWFRQGRLAWSIGAGFFPRFAPVFLKPLVASHDYDTLVFGQRTTATTPLP